MPSRLIYRGARATENLEEGDRARTPGNDILLVFHLHFTGNIEHDTYLQHSPEPPHSAAFSWRPTSTFSNSSSSTEHYLH